MRHCVRTIGTQRRNENDSSAVHVGCGCRRHILHQSSKHRRHNFALIPNGSAESVAAGFAMFRRFLHWNTQCKIIGRHLIKDVEPRKVAALLCLHVLNLCRARSRFCAELRYHAENVCGGILLHPIVSPIICGNGSDVQPIPRMNAFAWVIG